MIDRSQARNVPGVEPGWSVEQLRDAVIKNSTRSRGIQGNVGESDALSWMGFLIGVAAFALVVGAGYAIRQPPVLSR
jgi:hypothetical protein